MPDDPNFKTVLIPGRGCFIFDRDKDDWLVPFPMKHEHAIVVRDILEVARSIANLNEKGEPKSKFGEKPKAE